MFNDCRQNTSRQRRFTPGVLQAVLLRKAGRTLRDIYKAIGFSNSYGIELIINQHGHADYKDNNRGAKKTHRNSKIDCFKSEFNTEHIDNIIKVIEHAKNYSCTDIKPG